MVGTETGNASILEYEQFAPLFGPWAEIFKEFITSKEMFDIYAKLKAEKEKIVPSSDKVFEGFRQVMPEDVKVVWYLADPYPRRYRNKTNQATGVAMDCRNTPDGVLQPSLVTFYDALDKFLGKKVERCPSLEYLCYQGVMLLNTDLTCLLGKTGSHVGLWEPFHKYFLDYLANKPGKVYILSGKVSERMEKFINPLGNHIIKTEHPAAAARAERDWNYGDLFAQINALTNGKIKWDKKDWEVSSEPPF